MSIVRGGENEQSVRAEMMSVVGSVGGGADSQRGGNQKSFR